MADSVRDLNEARDAHAMRDVDASRAAHSFQPLKEAPEKHSGAAGEYVEAIVFGGLDGIVTTFAVVVAAAAAGLTRGLILIIGFANLVPEAVAMGSNDYASSLAEQEAEDAERAREQWEMDNKPDAEKAEMVECYKENGYTPEEAHEVVDLLWNASKPAFLEIMLIKELGIMPHDVGTSAWKSGLVTMAAFVILGAFPMLPYVFAMTYDVAGRTDGVFWASLAIFCVTLFVLGAFKGKIGGKRWWSTGFTMLMNGVVVTGISFGIGYGLEQAQF